VNLKLVDLKRVADALREECPFIQFAIVSGIDEEGRPDLLNNVELSVLLDQNTGFCYALEKILPVITDLIPTNLCEVVLLNRVDLKTRFKASNSRCLFIQQGMEQTYRAFIQQARLDFRIMKAKGRLNGVIYSD
jgi:hypothetical protein